MTLRRPSLPELQTIAADAHFELTDEELADYAELVDGILDQLERVQALPAPATPEAVTGEHGGRRRSYRPGADEDPHNAWIAKCEVEGAEDGALEGITVGLKDNIALAGVELTCGSHLLEGYVPRIDATVVTRLLAAGATIVGKTNMESFSFSSTSDITDFGPVENPRAPGRMACGSSSGSGAAVAAGEVDLALGCDQGGSIRMPAAACGIVGLKPTAGLVPYTGIVPIEPSIDNVGPMADSVRTCAVALDVLAGRDGLDPRQPVDLSTDDYAAAVEDADADTLTVGVLDEGFAPSESEPAVVETARDAIDAVVDAGATTTDISVPRHHEGPALWSAVGGYGGLQVLRQGGLGALQDGWYDTGQMIAYDKFRRAAGQDFPPTVKAVVLAQSYVERRYGSALYGKAKNLSRELRDAYDAVMADADVDILAMPTMPVPPFELPGDDPDRVERVANAGLVPLGLNTCPFNLTGHPAITVPCGRAAGAPVGLMLVAPHFQETTLLRAARTVEEAVDAH